MTKKFERLETEENISEEVPYKEEKEVQLEDKVERPIEEDKKEKLEKARERIAEIGESDQEKSPQSDYVKEEVFLSKEDRKEVDKRIAETSQGLKLGPLARVLIGNKTATEYDSKIRNFSTETSIETLPSGKKVFMVHNFSTSWAHRTIDNAMKRLTGTKIHKANRSQWKKQFEGKSTIPTIDNEDVDTIVMPYIPNINLRDLLADHQEIDDFGECEFAKEISDDQKLEIVDKVTDKTSQLHDKDITWGELTTHNMIVDKDMNVHICDPETEYYDEVPMVERKARDLYNFILTTSADLKKSSNMDYGVAAKRVIDRYQGKEVIDKLKEVAAEELGALYAITGFHYYDTLHFGSYGEFKKARQSIVEYAEKIDSNDIR